MSKMFNSYNKPIEHTLCHQPQLQNQNVKPIIDIQGKFLGVQARHALPFKLYFHLENFTSEENKNFISDILAGTAVFELLTLNGKSVLKQEYPVIAVLNQDTNDLEVTISSEEAVQLRRETYVMRVDLVAAAIPYRVYSEKDGYLVIR